MGDNEYRVSYLPTNSSAPTVRSPVVKQGSDSKGNALAKPTEFECVWWMSIHPSGVCMPVLPRMLSWMHVSGQMLAQGGNMTELVGASSFLLACECQQVGETALTTSSTN